MLEGQTFEAQKDSNLHELVAMLEANGVDNDDAWDFIMNAKHNVEGETRTVMIHNRRVTFKREDGVLTIVDPYGNI